MNKIIRFSVPLIVAFLFIFMLLWLVGESSSAVANPSSSAPEGSILVTTVEDELNNDGDCSLREAIMAANTNNQVDDCGQGDVLTDTITFDVQGTIYLNSQLEVTAGGPLLVDGDGQITTNGGQITRLFYIETGSDITLESLILKDGQVDYGQDGGGIYNHGKLILSNSTLSDNDATDGAGLINYGTVIITNSIISGNVAGYAGGGIINVSGSITITSSLITGNVSEGAGGALYISDGSLTISNSILSNNIANSGAGLRNYGTANIMNSVFLENGPVNYGGAIENIWGIMTISECIFYDNSAWQGGGIYNYDSPLYITNSTFSGNTTGFEGGAIYNTYGDVTLTNSTLSGNNSENGGGLFNDWGTVLMINTTISGNEANLGGGVFNEVGTLTLINSIVANSLSGGECSGTANIDGGHNISSDNSCNFSPANGSMPDTDPLLGPLQDNGGTSFTHALLPGSPAIDTGDDTQCPPTDQRGVPRPLDGDGNGLAICDIGSFEFEQGIYLQPADQAASGAPGTNIDYAFELYNFTNIADVYTLTLGIHDWDTSLSTDLLGPIEPGESQSFTSSVTIPIDAPLHMTDTVVITATSSTSPTIYTARAQVTTEAYTPPKIIISPTNLESKQGINQIVTQTMIITNAGFAPLDYEIYSGSGSGAVFFVTSDELYGYDVPHAWLRIIGTEDNSHVQVIDLADGSIIDENLDLDRYATWDVYPIDGTHYKIEADQPVLGYESDWDGWSHNTFVPSLQSGPIGNEFIFYYHRGYYNDAVYVFAIDDAYIEVYNPSGILVDSQTLSEGEYWDLSLENSVYHIVSTGRISIETVAANGYSTVPATTGEGVGRRFYFGTNADYTGALAVFAYQDTVVEVFDMDSGVMLYNQQINQGEYWWQRDVGTRRLRLESTGLVEVWAGDAEDCCGIEGLGDDISFAGGIDGREFYLHSLIDGSVIFALFNNTSIDIDGTIYYLDKDEFLDLDGCCYFRHVQSNQPILIQTLGRDTSWNDLGTYLGGRMENTEIVPWLDIDPISGTVPGYSSTIIQVYFDATNLQPDTYTATITIQSNDPITPTVEVPVTLIVTVITPTGMTISGPESGLVDIHYNFTATVEPVSTTLPITYTWQANEYPPITHTSGLSDTVGWSWEVPGTYAITVTASNLAGSVMDTHIITIKEPTNEIYLPLIIKSGGEALTPTKSFIMPSGGTWLGMVIFGVISFFKKRI